MHWIWIAAAGAVAIGLGAWWCADRLRFPGLLAGLTLLVLGLGNSWAGTRLLALWDVLPKLAEDEKADVLSLGMGYLDVDLIMALVATLLVVPAPLLALRWLPQEGRRAGWIAASVISTPCGVLIAGNLVAMWRIRAMLQALQAGVQPGPTGPEMAVATLQLTGAGMIGTFVGPLVVALSAVVGLVLLGRRRRAAMLAESEDTP